MPAALYQHNFFASGSQCGGRLLQRLVHGQRMRLGMKRQAAHEQHHQRVVVYAKRLSGIGFLFFGKFKILGMNAKRNNRQHGQHQLADS